jgi:hypothetical protein
VVHSRRGNLALQLVLEVPKDSALSYLFKAMKVPKNQYSMLSFIAYCGY